MYNNGIIPGYDPTELPLSKDNISKFLGEIRNQQNKISSTDKSILKKYIVEYNIDSKDENEVSFFSKPSLKNIFDDEKQKYLYAYKDSTVKFYLDGIGNLTERISRGDSLGNRKSLTGELGFRIKVNYNGLVAAYLRVTNGDQLAGDLDDFDFVRRTNPAINATGSVSDFGRTFFDTYEGYLRYQAKTNWIAVAVGRYGLSQGTGFIDNLFLSRYGIPFDFVKLNLNSNIFNYTFLYGSLRGDSLGKKLDSKNIATHRLDVHFSNKFKVGIFESVITSNSPFSFTFFNPVSFLTTAEYNKASQGPNQDINNTLLGFDALLLPIRKLSLQGSFLIDDLKFSTLFTPDAKKINKFAYQIGAFWSDAFTIPNLDAKLEYTKLDPFVYTHSSNKSSYTNWGYSLGVELPPNSDEIAAQLDYSVSSRLRFGFDFKFQRSGDGNILDSAGKIVGTYGGDINRSNGYNETTITPVFLQGNRKNRTILGFNLQFEPVKQYYINFNYTGKIFDNIFENRTLKDNYFTFGVRVDY